MKTILIIAALLAGLASCKKEDDDYVDLKDQVLFIEKRASTVSHHAFKYKMLSGAQKRIINGQSEFYRTPYSVYSDKVLFLNTYYKSPLDRSDSITSYP